MIKALIRTLTLSIAFVALGAFAQGNAARNDYQLGPGDDIRVQVFQNPDLTVEARVSESGTISYPLIGSVKIGGLSVGAAERQIAEALRSGGFVQAPQVNIVLVQVRGNLVSVLGYVKEPGRFPLETRTRVSDILAAAGGITPEGDDIVTVVGQRDGKPYRLEIDIPRLFQGLNQDRDVVLTEGDTIYVDRAPVFYIYGEAKRPGQYRVERGMTIMQALAQGGGPTTKGNENNLRLNRRNPDGTLLQIAPQMNAPVYPNDVIYVNESFF